MLSNFLNQTCNIYYYAKVNDNWIIEKVKTTIHSNIKCQLYSISWENKNTDVSNNTKDISNKCMLDPSINNIKIWYQIEIIDEAFWVIGTYEIATIKPNRLYWWKLYSVQLELKNI